MNTPLFYNTDAVLKYNVCHEGLYLNDEYGIHQNTSPYFGATKLSTGKWGARVHIPDNVYKQLCSCNDILMYSNRGAIPSNILQPDFAQRAILFLGTFDNERDAAYLSQMYRFSEDSFDLYYTMIMDKYVHENYENTYDTPEWTTEIINRNDYDPKSKEWQITKDIVKKALDAKEKLKEQAAKSNIVEQNKQRLIKNSLKQLANLLQLDKDLIGTKIDISDYMTWDGIPKLKHFNKTQLNEIKEICLN